MDMCKEAGVDISNTVIDSAHQIGEAYFNNKRKKNCKSVIVRFTTFRHRTMIYRAKKNMKNNVRVKLDLTKNIIICLFQQINLLQIQIQRTFVMLTSTADRKSNGQMTH